MKGFMIALLCLVLQVQSMAYAQNKQVFTISELYELVMENNQSLKTIQVNVDVAKQKTEVVRQAQLPQVGVDWSLGYLGDAYVIDNQFDHAEKVELPHFLNNFSIQASEEIFNRQTNANIEIASLQEKIAKLKLAKQEQDVKLIVAANYFDLFKLYNQKDVYQKNIDLAEQRLTRLQKLYEKGMVTKNELIRSELQLKNLRLSVDLIDKNAEIINQQLLVATGLSDSTVILPDSTILNNLPFPQEQSHYQERALNAPDLQTSKAGIQVAKKQVDLSKSERLPTVSVFVANALEHPITNVSPVVNKYENAWQIGFKLKYNLASLYKSKRTIQLAKMNMKEAEEQEKLAIQDKSLKIQAAYIAYEKAVLQTETLKENMRLADENYRIIEKKYLNQLALNIDMIDASNQKLSAELNHTNAEINVLYSYYQLLHESGNL